MRLNDYNKTALIEGTISISYHELIRRIENFAASLPIEKDEHVLLFSENRTEWIVALFAVWQKGGVAIPVDAASGTEEIAYFIKDSGAKAAIVSPACRPVLEKAADTGTVHVVPLDVSGVARAPMQPGGAARGEATALILYTSGTTGDPKGVMLSFDNLFSNIESIEEKHILSPDDVLLALLPFHHAYPLMTTILVPLHLGTTVVLQKSLAGDELLAAMQKEKVTILVGVPRLYELFHKTLMEKLSNSRVTRLLFKALKGLDTPKLAAVVFRRIHRRFGGHIRYFISGGAKLERRIQEDFRALGLIVLEGYGLSETSPIVSFNAPDALRPGSVGRPIRSTEVKVADGELLIRGKNVMQGYYNKPEKTAEAIRKGWFYTGDLGRIDAEGFVYVTGRKKEMIVLPDGKNINPEAIEKELCRTFPYVKESAVMQKGAGLAALIVPDLEKLHADGQFNLHESIKWKVIDLYNRQALSYKKILDYRIIDTDLPKTRLGKLKRFRLPDLLEAKAKPMDETEPNDETYKTLAALLSTLTDETIRPSAHLEIDLGIDSLGKVELQSFLSSRYGIEADEKKLAEFGSVGDLYRFVKERKSRVSGAQTDWEKLLCEPETFELYRGTKILRAFIALIDPLVRPYFSLRIKGLEHLPKAPFILAANHQSYLDPFLLGCAMPKKSLDITYGLGQIDFFSSFFSRNLGRYTHVIVLDYNRELKEAMQKSAFVLRENKNLLIFPEGARSRDGGMQEFKKFFAILSKTLDIPIVPVTIDGAYDAMPVGSRFPKHRPVAITFSPPVLPEGYEVDELVTVVKETIQKEIDR